MAAPTLTLVPASGGGPIPTAAGTPPEAPTPSAALTLYQLEDHLQALTETLDAVPAEQEADLLHQLAETNERAIAKRDAYGRFLAHLDCQVAFAAAEINRLKDRKATFERLLERAEDYILRAVRMQTPDPKGKYKALEGRAVTFKACKLPAAVEIADDLQVPTDYRVSTVKLPALLWERILDCLDLELAAQVQDQAKRSDELARVAIKAAIEEGREVPGAKLTTGRYRLDRK